MIEAAIRSSQSRAVDDAPLDLARERRLLAALAAGDRAAAEPLARHTYRLVFASLLKMSGDADVAADLTQETYRRAWSSLGSFDGRARFSTWLYRIAHNVFVSFRRRPRILEPLEEASAPEPASADEDPQRRLESAQQVRRLRRAVFGLPESLQLTVTARFWGEVPVAEIARLEGVTGPAIRKRLRRAETLLRQALTEEES